jgi:hypothetical protein
MLQGENSMFECFSRFTRGQTFVEVCETSGRTSKDCTGENFGKIRKIGLTQNRISESAGMLRISHATWQGHLTFENRASYI